LYVNGGIGNEHNDQDILTGVPVSYRIAVNIECFLGNVCNFYARLDEKKVTDKAFIEKFIAIQRPGEFSPAPNRQPVQVVGLFLSERAARIPVMKIINLGPFELI
jgi:hypothetical protein